jgi:hypothetical protein
LAALIIASASGPTPRGFAPGAPAAPQPARATIQLAGGSAILPDNSDDDVRGRTTDADGNPLGGVQVDFDGWPATLDLHFKTKSKSDGSYDINLPNGNWHVKASYYPSGHTNDAVSLVTADGKPSTLVKVPPGGTANFTAPKT